jgi:hypothetical protein
MEFVVVLINHGLTTLKGLNILLVKNVMQVWIINFLEIGYSKTTDCSAVAYL